MLRSSWRRCRSLVSVCCCLPSVRLASMTKRGDICFGWLLPCDGKTRRWSEIPEPICVSCHLGGNWFGFWQYVTLLFPNCLPRGSGEFRLSRSDSEDRDFPVGVQEMRTPFRVSQPIILSQRGLWGRIISKWRELCEVKVSGDDNWACVTSRAGASNSYVDRYCSVIQVHISIWYYYGLENRFL